MASLATLQSIAATLNADCVLLREKVIENERKAAQYLIRLKADEKVLKGYVSQFMVHFFMSSCLLLQISLFIQLRTSWKFAVLLLEM